MSKMYTLSLFLFITTLSINLLGALDFMGLSIQYDSPFVNSIIESGGVESQSTVETESGIVASLFSTVRGVGAFADFLVRTVFVKEMLTDIFLLPELIANLIAYPVLILYGATIFQVLSNRSLRSMS